MPVNLASPVAGQLHPVAGLKLGIASAGIKKPGRKDVTVILPVAGSTVAGVFTRNRFCAAPVVLCRTHLAAGMSPLALVINTGNANAGTGDEGMLRATEVCDAMASRLGCRREQILPFSTGVIMEPLPADKIVRALPEAIASADENSWLAAAEAIMTTDIVAKGSSHSLDIEGVAVHVTGIAKGSGMIHPNMATMLGFVATDAAVSADILQRLVSEAADVSFNCISVDGDTSTNDSFILIATGQSGASHIDHWDHPARPALQETINRVASELAQAIVRDGEGATKFIRIEVEQGRSRDECRHVAYAIAHSPLVKTAFFASDPNLGRILAAIGYAGITDLDVANIRVWLGDVLVAEHGGRAASYQEADGQRVMREAEITIRVQLNRGDAQATVWTCDFSYDYVKINAEYRS